MYDGVRGSEAFVTKFLKYANARGWDQRERFENTCWCLEGTAGDYYPVACRGLAIGEFNSLVARFAAKYGDHDLMEIMESSFQEACQSGLTLHDFRRTTDQIGCDVSRRVIAGNRGK